MGDTGKCTRTWAVPGHSAETAVRQLATVLDGLEEELKSFMRIKHWTYTVGCKGERWWLKARTWYALALSTASTASLRPTSFLTVAGPLVNGWI